MTVSPATIAVALGVAAPTSGSVTEAQWQMWIDDALMLVEKRLGDPSLLDQDALDYVVRESVVAHVRRPDDARQVVVSVDDASTSKTYSTSSATGRVRIADELWALLDPDLGGAAESFTITPYAAPDDSVALESWA